MSAQCKVEGCSNRPHRREVCSKHYDAWCAVNRVVNTSDESPSDDAIDLTGEPSPIEVIADRAVTKAVAKDLAAGLPDPLIIMWLARQYADEPAPEVLALLRRAVG